MMRHSACRQALLDGDLRPEVAEHLDQCQRCRRFARDLAQVAVHAAEMAPGPTPPDLADRVMARVRERAVAGDAPAVAALADGHDGRVIASRPALAALSVAAVMVLLVGVLAAFPRDDAADVAQPDAPAEIDAILAAAERTVDAGTARIRLRGTASGTITPPTDLPTPEFTLPPVAGFEPPPFQAPPPPDYSQLPPEQQEQFRQQYDDSIAESERQYNAFLEESRQSYDEYSSRAQDAFEGLDLPDEYSFEMSIQAEGAVVFPDRMRIDGEMEVRAGSLPGDPSGTFGVAVDLGTSYLLSPDGAWLRVPGVGGPLEPLLADPHGIVRLVVGATGDVSDLGEEELGGFAVRHYRFTVDASVFAPAGAGATGSGRVDVWVGVDTRVVHKLVSTASSDYSGGGGFRSRIDSSMTMELYDFGADVTVEIPQVSGSASAALGAAAVLTPFEGDMATSFFYEPPEALTPPTFGPIPAP